jgi:hypothetical protein
MVSIRAISAAEEGAFSNHHLVKHRYKSGNGKNGTLELLEDDL